MKTNEINENLERWQISD